MATLGTELKTFGRHPTEGWIIAKSFFDANGAKIGDTTYNKHDAYHTPWPNSTGQPSELIFGESSAAQPTVTPPASACYRSEEAGTLNLTFTYTDGGDIASNVTPTITISPDPGVADWLSIDHDAGTVDITGIADPGTYIVTMTVANSAGSTSSATQLDIVDAPTVGPAPARNVTVGETAVFAVPYAGGVFDLVSALPAWLTVVANGGVATFTASPPAGTPAGTTVVTVKSENCSGQASIAFDINTIATDICAPAQGFDVGGPGDLFTGGAPVGDNGPIGTAHASLSILQTTLTATHLTTKRNNNNGTMIATNVTAPADGCSYALNLVTAEEFYTTAGARSFDTLVNGVVRQAAYDPFAAAGNQQNVATAFQVPLDPGPNEITFVNGATSGGDSAVVYYAELVCLGCTARPTCPVPQVLVQGGQLNAVATYTQSPTVTVTSDNNSLVTEGGWITATDDAAGTITFTGTAPAANSTTVITVQTDDGGDIQSCPITITVNDPATDTPPVVTAPGNVVIAEGNAVPGGTQFTVADDGVSPVSITTGVTGSLAGAVAVDDVSGIVSGTAPPGSVGQSALVTYRATDNVDFDEKSMTVTVAAGGTCPDPSNWRIIPGFDPNVHLPTQAMRDAHTSFKAAYDHQEGGYNRYANLFNGPAQKRLEFHPTLILDPPDYLGSYSICRPWTFGLYGLADFLRTTGDPWVLDQMVYWSDLLKTHFEDPGGNGWDNRGYKYARYRSPGTANSTAFFNDTNFLDEAMMSGTLALVAWMFHENRDLNPTWAEHADYWFDYLDTAWVPKWLYRTHYAATGGDPAYTPAAGLGLGNAINWSSSDQAGGLDKTQSPHPRKPMWGTNGMRHPTREFAHAAIMQIGCFYFLGRYFTDMNPTADPLGINPIGNWTGTAAEYTTEAVEKAAWWHRQVTITAHDSLTWWLFMNGTNGAAAVAQAPDGTRGLDTDGYSHHCNYWSQLFHWVGFGAWDEAKMIQIRKAWWNPGAPNTNYIEGNRNAMKAWTGGTNGDITAQMRTVSLLAPWDATGELRDRTENWAIINETSHRIGSWAGGNGNITTNSVDGLHYCGILSDELKTAIAQGACA